MALNSQLLTVQILTNDVQVLILCLSDFITTVHFYVYFLDPALILQDPLARDQDNDARISDAIQNDFERKQHNWRNKIMP